MSTVHRVCPTNKRRNSAGWKDHIDSSLFIRIGTELVTTFSRGDENGERDGRASTEVHFENFFARHFGQLLSACASAPLCQGFTHSD